MVSVRIIGAGVAQPENWIDQAEAARRIGDATGDHRRVSAVARGSQIERRAIAAPADCIGRLGSIAERNDIYRQVAPDLALRASGAALASSHEAVGIDCVVTSSCTGYMVPGWDVDLVQRLRLPLDSVRLPITQAGCAGGVVALARAADYLRLRPGRGAIAVAAELCSLAFHRTGDAGNLTSSLLFGDGAGAAVLTSDEAEGGLEIVDSLSTLVPCSQAALGFDLTDRGFYPVLTRELADVLPAPTARAASEILRRNSLGREDVSFFLMHPGGPRILSVLQAEFGLTPEALPWSWCSLRQLGNTSSAAIFDVLRRYLEDPTAPGGWGIVAAFGPGVSNEMLLVRRC